MAAPKTRDEVIAISNRTADEYGIPRVLLLACAIAESNLVWNARRPVNPAEDARSWPDVSGGVWQQTVRYDPDYRGGEGYPGPAEVERVLQLQYDVERSARVAAANLARKFRDGTETDDDGNLIRDLYEYNWPAGRERPFTPAHEANYRRGLAEARTILGTTPMPDITLTYNPGQPPERQVQDWACSIRTAAWVLKSLGIPASAELLQDEMVPSIVTPQVGLLDARGYGLAQTIRAHLSPVWHDRVHVLERVGWDDVRSIAGMGPIALGGRAWYHWVAVRKPNADGTLAIANPAPGYKGVGDTLSRQQWDQLGPFSAVWVNTLADVAAPKPVYYQPGDVGSGLLALMAADGTEPAAPSTFLPLGRSPALIEECVALSGWIYRWHLPTGRSWRYPPAA